MIFNVYKLHSSYIRLNNCNIAKLVEKRGEAGGNSQKGTEATEEVREAGDVYPPAPPPL